ncbi:PD40 domain-containing protein [Paenibacillus sp. Soil750]|uniref:PD40 domain-containing protein n=1 Tax=Paenibacillus sp. Soil750 TaxID=1736398 RepID=UPI0006F84B43|nr:PD40 domain-containing protein [Paenibacillus sp. Soil750]KRE55888.1 hypothetical protein ASL11_34690 [Paenibacillus sp. Soil750]
MKQLVCLAVMTLLLSSSVIAKSQVATKHVLDENTDIVLDSSKSWTASRLEGIHGTGWISDHEIEFVQSVKVGTDEAHEPNYIDTMGNKDIISGEVSGEKPGISYDIYAVSPDGRHIYVKQNHMEDENYFAQHRIISRDGGETKEIANQATAGSAVWLDNEHVLYMGGIGDNGVVQIDLQGKMTPMPALNQWMVPNKGVQVSKVGERLYFLVSSRLSYIELSLMDNPVLHTIFAENVNRFYPSPDGHQIAVVSTVLGSLSQSDRMKSELLLLDPDGNPIGDRLETGEYFNKVSWSPDQSKLTYVVAKHYPDKYEVHVVDMKIVENKMIYKSGNQVAVSEFFWSPNSKLMMFSVNRSHSTLESKPETIIYKFN